MKKFKRLLAVAIAALSLSMLIPVVNPVQAASKTKVIYNYTQTYDLQTYQPVRGKTQKNMELGLYYTYTFNIYSEGTNAKVKDLKVDKKGLQAKITRIDGRKDSTTVERATTVSLYAKKTGKYKVTFKIDSKKYTLNVKVVDLNVNIKKATFGDEIVEDNSVQLVNGGMLSRVIYDSKMSKPSGKLNIIPGSGCKITGFVVGTVDKKGKIKYKEYKNNSKITLSKGRYKYKLGTATYTTMKKDTYIWVSYKNKYGSWKYSVAKNPVTKKNEVKYVWSRTDGSKGSYFTTAEDGDMQYTLYN